MSKDCAIFDFETLSLDRFRTVITCVAGIRFNEDRYMSDEPYTFDELLEASLFMKFNVGTQVKNYGRKIDKSTLDWWRTQPKAAQDQLIEPSDSDAPFENIGKFFSTLIRNHETLDKIYTRGNTFDPIIVDGIVEQLNLSELYPFWKLRDTRSMIDGLAFGADIKNSFTVPGLEEKFVAHDPRHDVAMDIMRMQYLVRLLNDLEV